MKFYDWRMDAVRGGNAYHIDIGAFSTGVTGGGNGTTIDQDQPEGIVSCPSGYSIIPTRVHVVYKTAKVASDGDESEIVLAADVAAAAAGTTGIAGATAETALNMHSGCSNTSACSCYSASTANWTNPTLGMELAHVVHTGATGAETSTVTDETTLLYEPVAPPILTGPCALYLYWGGTVASSGFAQVEWVELKDA